MSEQLKSLIEKYTLRGYVQCHIFPGEYVLMINKKFNYVRIYLNGSVWVQNEFGVYNKAEQETQNNVLKDTEQEGGQHNG